MSEIQANLTSNNKYDLLVNEKGTEAQRNHPSTCYTNLCNKDHFSVHGPKRTGRLQPDPL